MAQTKNKEYSKASICIISIGGTIASIAKGGEDGVFPALGGSDIVQSVPGLEESMSIRIESPYTVPSNQLTFDHLLSLYQSLVEMAESDPEVGFVITTGTDTLEESAYFVDLLYNYPNPIIFTGAMRAPSQICPDGPRNLQDAALAAASPLCRELGVLVVMNGEIHAARDVTKTHSTDVASFRSPMLGPLGTIHGEKVIIRRRPFRREWIDTRKAANCVELIRCVLGDSGRAMNAKEEDIGHLRKLKNDSKKCLKSGVKNWKRFYRLEDRMHRILARMTENPLFESVLITVYENCPGYNYQLVPSKSQHMKDTHEDWCQLIKAIEDSRPDKAGWIMTRHIQRFLPSKSGERANDKKNQSPSLQQIKSPTKKTKR